MDPFVVHRGICSYQYVPGYWLGGRIEYCHEAFFLACVEGKNNNTWDTNRYGLIFNESWCGNAIMTYKTWCSLTNRKQYVKNTFEEFIDNLRNIQLQIISKEVIVKKFVPKQKNAGTIECIGTKQMLPVYFPVPHSPKPSITNEIRAKLMMHNSRRKSVDLKIEPIEEHGVEHIVEENVEHSVEKNDESDNE